MSGIRLVIDEFRTDVTKTLKSGERGRLRIDYGDPHKPGEAVKWMWKFIDGAKTAGELYGRALVVIAAEQYASRLVVPDQPAHPPNPVGIAQGPRGQGAAEAGRTAPAGITQATRAGDRPRPSRVRHGCATARRGPRSGAALRTDRNARRGTRRCGRGSRQRRRERRRRRRDRARPRRLAIRLRPSERTCPGGRRSRFPWGGCGVADASPRARRMPYASRDLGSRRETGR